MIELVPGTCLPDEWLIDIQRAQIIGTDGATTNLGRDVVSLIEKLYGGVADDFARACSHYRKPSTIKAKEMNAINITSSLSNREKSRRNPLSRRNNRSISLRRLYRA